jgi:hypothetical protein
MILAPILGCAKKPYSRRPDLRRRLLQIAGREGLADGPVVISSGDERRTL